MPTDIGGGIGSPPPVDKKKKKKPAPAPVSYGEEQRAAHEAADPITRVQEADTLARREEAALRQQHRAEVEARRAGRAERQITRSAGEYLRENTLYNAPERQAVLEGVNVRVGLIDPRLLASAPELAAELVMGTIKSSALRGASLAAYQGWRAQQEDLFNAQQAGQARGYHNITEEMRRTDPQGYALGQRIAADPVLAEITQQISGIGWLSPEKRAYLMKGVADASTMDGTAYEYQVQGLYKQLKLARQGKLEIPTAPTEGFGEFLKMAQDTFNIIPFGISQITDYYEGAFRDVPGGAGNPVADIIDTTQEAVGDVMGAAGTGAAFIARNAEGVAALAGEAPSAAFHAIAGGEPPGGFLTADELWTTWGEIEGGEHGPFSVILARNLNTDVDDPRYQNWYTFTDMTADLIGQVGMFRALTNIKTAIRATEAGGGRFSGATMVNSRLLGGPRLVDAIWKTIEEVPEGQRTALLVNKFKKGMTPTLANDLARAVTRDQTARILARHLDDVPDVEIPQAAARLAQVQELRRTSPLEAQDALRAEEAALKQRIWDLTVREPIFEFPRISHIRPFMRGVEKTNPVARIARVFFGGLRETHPLDLSRITNDLTHDAAKLWDPQSLTKPVDWASQNFDVLRKTMDLVRVDKHVQSFVLEAMFEVEKGNLSFFAWRRMIEDAYRSGKRYTPDMEEGIRLSSKSVDERTYSYTEVTQPDSSTNIQPIAKDQHGNPLPVRPSELLEDSVALPSMRYLEMAGRTTSALDAWAKNQPALIGKTVGALRTTTAWTTFVMFQGPRLILRPLLLALNPKMFTKIEVDQGLRGFFKAGVTPLDWWSLKGRRIKANVDLVEGGVPVEPQTLKTKLPKKEDPLTSKESPDYTVMGLVANEMVPDIHAVRTKVSTGFDPATNPKLANEVAQGLAEHVIELAHDPLTSRIAANGAEATIKFIEEHPNHPLSIEIRTKILPKLEATRPAPDLWQGTGREGGRFAAGDPRFDDLQHMSTSPETAATYGPVVTGHRINPQARILVEGTPEFEALKPAGFDSSTATVKQMGDFVDVARGAGYDIIKWADQDAIGTTILNSYATTPVGGTLADIIRQQELEIKQASGGMESVQRAIATNKLKVGLPEDHPNLPFVEDELRIAREELRLTEGALGRETLNLRIEQLERKAGALKRIGARDEGFLSINDKDALARRIREAWEAGDFTPTKEVFVKRRLAGHTPGDKLTAAKQWAHNMNQRIYKGFAPMNAATRDMSRGSLWRKVYDTTEKRLLDMGYSKARAIATAQYRANFVTTDLMYDISARSTIDRKLQELFWFEPVWREQLSVWLVKLPSQAFWAPGLALEIGMATTLLDGLKDMGLITWSEDYKDPETGNTIAGRPYFHTPWGNFGVGGFNPLSPASESYLPTISPGAEQVFDFTARHMPEDLRPFFEAFADKFTFDRNIESTPWMPRGVALVASEVIGIGEFFGIDLSGITIGAIGEARKNSEVKARQWAMSDMVDEGITPPVQKPDESDDSFYRRVARYEDQIEARARRYGPALDFLFTLNTAIFPGTLKDAGTAPEGVAWNQWRYEDGPLAGVTGILAPWQYDIQNAYLSAHPEQWPWAVGKQGDTDPDPDIYNPAPLDAEAYTLKAMEQYHYWGDPPTIEKKQRDEQVKKDAEVFNALEPRKQAKLLAQWSTDDVSELTPLQATALGLPDFKGRDQLLHDFGVIQRSYENKYAYDKPEEVKKYLANERDFLLERAAAEYGAGGEALLNYIQASPFERLTDAGLLTTPESNIIKQRAGEVKRKTIAEGGDYHSLTGYGMAERKIELYRLVDSLRAANPAFDRELRYIELGLGERDGPAGRVAVYEYIFFNNPENDWGYQDEIVKGLH